MRCRGAHANFRRTKSIMERPFLCAAKEVERQERERAWGENDERKRGLWQRGGGTRAHRRDYRTKLRTKVIRSWRRGRVFGITGGLCAAGFIFLHCEIMDWDRANALLSSSCSLLSSFIVDAIISRLLFKIIDFTLYLFSSNLATYIIYITKRKFKSLKSLKQHPS